MISIGTSTVSVVPSGYVTSIGTFTKPGVAFAEVLLVIAPVFSSTETDSIPAGSVPALKVVPEGTDTSLLSTSRISGICG